MTAPISEKSALVQLGSAQKKSSAGGGTSETGPLGFPKHDSIDLNGPEDEAVSIPEFGWLTDLSWSDSVSGNIDSKSVSTAYSTPAESRESTSSELNVSKSDERAAEGVVGREIGQQEQAQGESQRRADQAQGALEALENNQRQLEGARGDADEQKSARLHRSAEGEKEVHAGEKRLEAQSQQLEELQTAGERLLAKQSRTQSAVEETQSEIYRTGDLVLNVKQESEDAEREVQEHSDFEPPGRAKKEAAASGDVPAGRAGHVGGFKAKPGNAANSVQGVAPASAAHSPARRQSRPGSAPRRGAPSGRAGDKPKPVTRQGKIRRARQARTAQVMAERKQKSLQDKQTHLKKVSQQHDWGVDDVKYKLHNVQESRRRGADGLQTARRNLQQDVDGLRDLGVKTQHIHSQLEELKAGHLQAMKARASNLQNAQSAGRNAEQLKGVRTQLAQQPLQSANRPSAGPSPWTTQAGGRPGISNDNSLTRPVDQLGTPTASNGNSAGMPAPADSSFSTRDQGSFLHIRLIRLNEGQGSAGSDQGAAPGRSQGRIADEQNQGQAELQAKATTSQAQSATPGQESAMVHNAPSSGNFVLGGMRSDQGSRSFL